MWNGRLTDPDAETCTLVAEDGATLIGFVHVVYHDDPAWGALIDNLHVLQTTKRGGLGTRLMAEAAATVAARPDGGGLYLWVLEQNLDAQAFYDARGGRSVERRAVHPPGGIPGRLNGTPAALRYVWTDLSVLLRGT